MVWALKAMQKAYNAVGITSTIDRAEGPEGFRVYQEFARKMSSPSVASLLI